MPTGIYERKIKRKWMEYICATCGKKCKVPTWKSRRPSRFCSTQCWSKWRRKYPPVERLVELFNSGVSIPEISRRCFVDLSKTYKLLRGAGIDTSKDRPRKCKANGCTNEVLKVWHSTNKCWYGRLCKEHRQRQYRKYSREARRRDKGLMPSQYKPWERKDSDLTEFEKEKLCLLQAKKELKAIRAYLTKQYREA